MNNLNISTHTHNLNNCLYTVSKFGQSIFDILQFLTQRIALTGDIERAFLIVSVKEDRDLLRFLWISEPSEELPQVIILRFTRVAFGVSSSNFLLNATISHHMEQYRQSDPDFMDKFLSSIYVDDLVTGIKDLESTYELYMKAKLQLATAGFKLRKSATNSKELSCRIQESESSSVDEGAGKMSHSEDDQSYAKSTLGVKTEVEPGINTVFGVQWSFNGDEFQFNVRDVIRSMEDLKLIKRDVVSSTARFFDPLGIISPVTVLFKIFCQQICKAKIGWVMIKETKVITVPRCLHRDVSLPLNSVRLLDSVMHLARRTLPSFTARKRRKCAC